MSILIHIFANAAAIWAADYFLPGFNFTGGWKELFLAGAVLGIINSFIRPIVKLIALPVIFLTLGLFTVIINIALLLLAAWLIPDLHITGFWSALWGVVIISFVNHLIIHIFHTAKKSD